MKKIFSLIALLALGFAAVTAKESNMNITVTIGGSSFAAVFEDNAVSREMAARFPLALTMNEWAWTCSSVHGSPVDCGRGHPAHCPVDKA